MRIYSFSEDQKSTSSFSIIPFQKFVSQKSMEPMKAIPTSLLLKNSTKNFLVNERKGMISYGIKGKILNFVFCTLYFVFFLKATLANQEYQPSSLCHRYE